MTTLAMMLRTTVRHNRERTAIVADEARFTWREFGDRVARAAAVLAGLGVEPGERFAIIARNGFRFEEMKFAGYWLGAVPVPVNWRLAPPEIRHVLADSGCRLIAIEDEFAGVMEDEALAPWSDRVLQLGPAPADGASAPYEALLAECKPLPAHDGDEDDDAVLLYTGGTTGRSKGVRLSHRNILSNALHFGLATGARRDDIYLHAAPMFHSADLLATGWIMLGAGHSYLPGFTPAEFFRIAGTHRPTATTLVPTMIIMLLSDPGFAAADLSSLRLVNFGASPMAVEWIERMAKAFPDADFANCYGLTETAPDLTYFDPHELRAAIASGDRDGPVASVGKPSPGIEIRIVDGDGNDVPDGEPGELLARGANIMKGYLNLPEETARALRGGWLHTGDIARIDGEGYVYLLDRSKDMVISGGENVYSAEVEAALHQHPDVHEAAIIGVPDQRLGEAVFAVIVPRPGATPSEDEIVAHCRGRIGGYKIPRRMAFVDAMPKSAMGKILKGELRRIYGG